MADTPAQDAQAMETLLADVTAESSEVETEKPEGSEADAETETQEPDAETEPEASEETDAKDADDAGKDDSEEPEETPKKSRSGLDRIRRRLAAAEAELQAARSRLGDSGEPNGADVEKLIGKPPNEDDFKGDFLKFERALTVYDLRKAQAEDRIREQAQSTRTAADARRREMAEAHQDRIEEFRGKAKDFDDVLKSASNLKASPAVEDLVLDSDKSAHLVYFLAKNPARLERLNEMTEREAAREIGRIEARLSLPAPKTKTSAPKPVAPPKGGAAPSDDMGRLNAWLKQKYG